MVKNTVAQYLRESFSELNKVTWPTKNQAVRLTLIVLGFTLVIAIFIGLLDLIFNYGFEESLTLLRGRL